MVDRDKEKEKYRRRLAGLLLNVLDNVDRNEFVPHGNSRVLFRPECMLRPLALQQTLLLHFQASVTTVVF